MDLQMVEEARAIVAGRVVWRAAHGVAPAALMIGGDVLASVRGSTVTIDRTGHVATFSGPRCATARVSSLRQALIDYGSRCVAEVLGAVDGSPAEDAIYLVRAAMQHPGELRCTAVRDRGGIEGIAGYLVEAPDVAGLVVGRVVGGDDDNGAWVEQTAVDHSADAWDNLQQSSRTWHWPRWVTRDGAVWWAQCLAVGVAMGDPWALRQCQITDDIAASQATIRACLRHLRNPTPAAAPGAAAAGPQGDDAPGPQLADVMRNVLANRSPQDQGLEEWQMMRAAAVQLMDLRARQDSIGGPGVVAFLARRLGDAMILMPLEINQATQYRITAAAKVRAQVQATATALLALSAPPVDCDA